MGWFVVSLDCVSQHNHQNAIKARQQRWSQVGTCYCRITSEFRSTNNINCSICVFKWPFCAQSHSHECKMVYNFKWAFGKALPDGHLLRLYLLTGMACCKRCFLSEELKSSSSLLVCLNLIASHFFCQYRFWWLWIVVEDSCAWNNQRSRRLPLLPYLWWGAMPMMVLLAYIFITVSRCSRATTIMYLVIAIKYILFAKNYRNDIFKYDPC